MPSTFLTSSGRVRLPRRPLTFLLEVVGDARGVTLAFAPSVRAITPRPGMWILPDIGENLAVDAVAVGAAPFPDPTVLHLTVIADHGSRDPHNVTVSAINASGLRRTSVLRIESGPSGFTLQVDLGDPDPELPDLAAAARVAARRILGVRTVDPPVPATTVIVDASASMASSLTDGTVAALVEVIAGVSAVTAPAAEVSLILCGATRQVVTGPAGELVARLEAEVRRTTYRTGFPVAAELARVRPTSAHCHVVTDATPTAWVRPDSGRTAFPDGDVTTVVLSYPDALTSEPDLGHPTRAGGRPWTQVAPPRDGQDVRARWRAEPDELSNLVSTLLSRMPARPHAPKDTPPADQGGTNPNPEGGMT